MEGGWQNQQEHTTKMTENVNTLGPPVKNSVEECIQGTYTVQ